MRIALIGAHGTGKTTLATALADELRMRQISVEVTPEIPRIICDRAENPEYFRRGNNKLLKQILLLVGQPIYEQAAGHSSVCVCDRSILDHWAYTKHFFFDEMITEKIAGHLEFLVAKHMNSYDQLFYVPIEFSAEDDGTREGDADFQSAIDREIRDLLSTHAIEHRRVNGSVGERLSIVLKEFDI